MVFMFRSFKMVIVSLILIYFVNDNSWFNGVFWNSVKTINDLVFSIAFGLSVDDTIHFFGAIPSGVNKQRLEDQRLFFCNN
jgi:hypothetical protein